MANMGDAGGGRKPRAKAAKPRGEKVEYARYDTPCEAGAVADEMKRCGGQLKDLGAGAGRKRFVVLVKPECKK